jgi:NADH-quinone oxidoreductase subunit F
VKKMPERALSNETVTDLDHYYLRGGGRALNAARAVEPELLSDLVDDAGLRGRGGAGFPTGRKWRTVAANCAPTFPATVVVNAAEGEPGAFKDRMILRRDPYRVLEGALIAAHAIGADEVIVATKRSFTGTTARLRQAVAEVVAAGWFEGGNLSLFEGPSSYLFGEETALLECIDGRYPFPRIAPPYRRGAFEVVDTRRDVTTGSKSAAHVELAGPGPGYVAPPALVSNVESMANVAGIVRRGTDWFRCMGTEQSPGSHVCTVTGDVVRHGVAEIPMGMTLREVIEMIGGGPRPGRTITAVMSGVANPLLPADALDTPLTYEDMRAAGAGLGAAGFIVFDDSTDLLAVAAGVARFLAVESCGQCLSCKRDGLVIADVLERAVSNAAKPVQIAEMEHRLGTVTKGARCALATQQQVVVESVLQRFPEALEDHLNRRRLPTEPYPIAPITDIVDGRAIIDEHQLLKQPDWTYHAPWSGQMPSDRYDDHRAPMAM